MGRLKKNIKNRTLRGQIVSSFNLILVSSVIATLITWGLIAIYLTFLFQNDKVKPANYYEKQIPEMVTFIQQQGNVLDKKNKDHLEQVIPLEGLDYQVVDMRGNPIYGSMKERYLTTEEELVNNINTNMYDGQKNIKYFPIFNENRMINGAVGFRYKLSLIAANPQSSTITITISVVAFLSPFFYFYLFSLLIGKRFSSRIEQPFNEIIEGAHKIQHHDLDFSLAHIESIKELNQLVSAFEEMKEALRDSLHMQWKLEQDRKDMVAAIAHDLKTPLTIIQGHVEGLSEMKDHHPERVERYLLTIQSSCRRSIQLIRELNDVSQIDQPEFTLTVSPTNIESWVHRKTEEFYLLCESKNITFEAIVDKAVSETKEVWIDLYRINQVLDNVLSNSLNYAPINGEIKWKTTITYQNIIFEVFDNGPGFSNKDKSKIFEKFYRGDPSRTSATGHSGLGLFIAQTITKKHGGEISVQNRVEGGAYVKVVIKNMKESLHRTV